jgi:hypothetical protein
MKPQLVAFPLPFARSILALEQSFALAELERETKGKSILRMAMSKVMRDLNQLLELPADRFAFYGAEHAVYQRPEARIRARMFGQSDTAGVEAIFEDCPARNAM